jgi:Na+-transporting NADH:ubiquinone oxidoreductase subunit NqrD
MAEIIFNPEERGELSYGPRRELPQGGALTRAFMRLFKVESEAQANRWLLSLSVAFFLLSVLIWWIF